MNSDKIAIFYSLTSKKRSNRR